MVDETATNVHRLLAELAKQMPMSEAEFRFRVEPLRADREGSVRTLLDALGVDLAVAALHEIASGADTAVLTAAFRDPGRSERDRGEIAQLLTAVAADQLDKLLRPEEIHHLSLLSIDTLLDRLRDRGGLTQVVELYRGSSSRERRALLDAITAATRRPEARIRLGAAFDPLYPHEADASLRALMIRSVAARSEAASARALARWLGHSHGVERRRVLEALRRLQHFGIRPAARTLEAWLSGVDATGSFNVGISFPAALDLRDIVLVCVSVEAGLRAVNVITAVAPETTSEIGRALEEGQSIPVAAIDVPTALDHIERARRRTSDLGRPLPEGYASAAAYLQRPLAVAKPSLTAAGATAVSRAQAASLLDTPAYAAWAFGESELNLTRNFAGGQAPSARRLRDAARAAVRDLEGTPATARLVAMLRHQSEVHRLRREAQLAARSLAVAREIQERGLAASTFARRLVDRSIVAALTRGPKTPRTDVRDILRRRIEDRVALRRRAVATLDLAEALYRQLENSNERATPASRLPLADMESIALAAAEACVLEFSRDASEQQRLPGMEAPVTARARLVRQRVGAETTASALERSITAAIAATGRHDSETAARLAAALVSAARWFAREVCLKRCRQGCLQQPEADGRALFFGRSHPAGPGFSVSEPDGAVRGSTSAAALRQHLERRLDEWIEETTGFLTAFECLGVAARGEDRTRLRRAKDSLQRLHALRKEVERLEEDPAWLYALVEETEPLARELRTLRKHLLGSALGRITPRAEQFTGFRPSSAAVAAGRHFERQMRRLGLIGLSLKSLQAAADRLENPAALMALLRAVGVPASARFLARLNEALAEFWKHTPRSALGARSPAEIAE